MSAGKRFFSAFLVWLSVLAVGHALYVSYEKQILIETIELMGEQIELLESKIEDVCDG